MVLRTDNFNDSSLLSVKDQPHIAKITNNETSVRKYHPLN